MGVNSIMIEKIVFIAPDEKLADKASQVISELNENIEVYQGSLSEGLKRAIQAVEDGANLIISRGGTGNLIKRNLHIPVVNLETNSFDLINAIYKAVAYSNNIGIVGFESLIFSIGRISEIMQNTFSAKITISTIKSQKEINKKIVQMYKSGVRVFIGGQAVINAAQKLGYDGILIESGKEAIAETIMHSKHILEVQLKEKEKAEILKSIIDFAYDGIFGVDKNGHITVFNPVAEKIIGVSAEKAIGRPVDDVVENSRISYVLKTGEAELSEIQHIGEISIVTNRVPIVVEGEVIGVVATFQELEKIQKVEVQIRKKLFLKGHIAKARFADIIGNSKAIVQAKEKASQYAVVDSTVLILGETGTGKELFAQSIHNSSLREDKLFVAVNCAALPESLLESELFGYVDGAFTGARKEGRAGLFEFAHGGTVFLDEISEMSPKLQARFLRVLQEKEVMRLGDDRVIPVNVRVIAATNRDLYNQVEKGEFREDLYYRLSVLRLEIPPLRKRTEDISMLVSHFIEEKGTRLGKRVRDISNEALEKLVLYHWPGNVRHLENIIERSVVLCKRKEISVDIIMEAMNGAPDFLNEENSNSDLMIASKEGVIKLIEYETIKKVLKETKGNKTLAAEKLGISITTLWRRLKSME